MNFSRVITGVLSSHTRRSSKWLSIHRFPFAALQLASLSDDAAAPAKRTSKRVPKRMPEADPPTLSPSLSVGAQEESLSLDVPPPKEIPFQIKVANQVHLIGSVRVPVQLQMSPCGSFAAVSILAREADRGLPKFWIPVIFQGDLAQIAASHLKENDVIYVTGQLSSDALPHTIEDATTNIQVLADSLSYVQNVYPGNVRDNMKEKVEPTSVPADNTKKMVNSAENAWNNLILNPDNWWDNRTDKLNGLVNQNFPDFINKETGKALWLDSAPSWVLPELNGLVFDTDRIKKTYGNSNRKPTKQSNSEILWKSLVDNPDDWWDNRSNKFNPRSPDFKHKTTGEGLWLIDAPPQWILEKLPPMKKKNAETFSSSATLLS